MTSPPTEKRSPTEPKGKDAPKRAKRSARPARAEDFSVAGMQRLSLIHISEPTRPKR